MKRVLPVAVALMTGWIVLLDMLLEPAWLGPSARILLEIALVLSACALLYGTAHLGVTHVSRLVRHEPEGLYGAVLVGALLVTFISGVAAPTSGAMTWIFRYLYSPLQATLLGLMTFVLICAVYRVARLHQKRALPVVGLGLALLLIQVLASDTISPILPDLRDWIMRVPVTAGMRGILLGIALGMMAAGMRLLLASDRPYTGE
ncbi:MAG: hypothetical protein GXX94_07440 [Chloroflexi bacterium]|nr:hypothetical protein [Chloroflexota bacterium]